MANQVALSQAEVDKLMGLSDGPAASKKNAGKQYKVNKFLSERQFEEITAVCKAVYKHFKLSLRKRFGEPKIRRLTITSLAEQNVDEFFDSLSDNDFVYEVRIGGASALIKFDSFLFAALSGMAIDTKHKINLFQSEVLKDFVALSLAEGFARQLGEPEARSIEINSLYDKEKSPFRTGETGVCVTISWNENLRSFGIEKIFLTEGLVRSFRALS